MPPAASSRSSDRRSSRASPSSPSSSPSASKSIWGGAPSLTHGSVGEPSGGRREGGRGASAGPGRRPGARGESRPMNILGIDPGLASTGYGVVARRGGRLLALDGGVIETDASAPAETRLAEIHSAVAALIDEHEPEALALEELY